MSLKKKWKGDDWFIGRSVINLIISILLLNKMNLNYVSSTLQFHKAVLKYIFNL